MSASWLAAAGRAKFCVFCHFVPKSGIRFAEWTISYLLWCAVLITLTTHFWCTPPWSLPLWTKMARSIGWFFRHLILEEWFDVLNLTKDDLTEMMDHSLAPPNDQILNEVNHLTIMSKKWQRLTGLAKKGRSTIDILKDGHFSRTALRHLMHSCTHYASGQQDDDSIINTTQPVQTWYDASLLFC